MGEPVDESSMTRIFITGLPPSLTKEQLRSHFAAKYDVTDCHLVSGRRIGFIGLSDHITAQDAVKYFDRTFMRMSKISVSLAKPVEMKRDSRGLAAPVSQRRQAGQVDGLLIPSHKRKRDIHDDGDNDAPRASSMSTVHQTGGEDTTAAIPKTIHAERHSSPPQSTQDMDEGNALLDNNASDADWMRGKTNRLLDLVETDHEPSSVSAASHAPSATSPLMRASDSRSQVKSDSQEPSPGDVTQPELVPNARLFLRNLPFNTTHDSLRSIFSPYGTISDIHLVKDTRTDSPKGLAYIQFVESQDAGRALLELDGKDFQGRLIHILPASDKKTQKLDAFEISKLPLKQQKALKRKAEAATFTFSWNSLYMNPDAVLASVANRLGVAKAELLDPSSTDAAVKQAHAETSVIRDTKAYLKSHGMNIEAFKNRARDDTTILLKNFAFGTTTEELSQLLAPSGKVIRLVFPPTGTIAVAQFEESAGANLALKQLAYRNLNGSVLYLEKAPEGLWSSPKTPSSGLTGDSNTAAPLDEHTTMSPTATLFVRNLNFSTTSAKLSETFRPLPGFLSAKVKTRTDAKRPGQVLSMGFAFVEFRTKAQAESAVSTMNGRSLDGHELLVQISQKSTDAAEERRKEDTAKKLDGKKTKIIVKNLPFEASKKDVRALLGPYGKLRTVRLPRKFDNSARGFAFAEFVTAKEAENAMDALSNTHLLGRKLVLDFAEGDAIDPEDEISAMEKKIQGHQSVLTHQKLTGSARRKFNLEAARDDFDPL